MHATHWCSSHSHRQVTTILKTVWASETRLRTHIAHTCRESEMAANMTQHTPANTMRCVAAATRQGARAPLSNMLCTTTLATNNHTFGSTHDISCNGHVYSDWALIAATISSRHTYVAAADTADASTTPSTRNACKHKMPLVLNKCTNTSPAYAQQLNAGPPTHAC